MLKLSIKFTLREKQDDETTENTRLLLLKHIENKKHWETHKMFFNQMAQYFIEKKKFTLTQYQAVRRLLDG